MKKFFALMLAISLCLVMVSLTGCGVTDNDGIPDYTIFHENSQTDTFNSTSDFLQYLHKFDYEKNEIISFYTDEFYYHITWKLKDFISNTSDEQTTTPTQITISVKEILQNNENYIVIATDDTVTMVPKNVAKFVFSTESNLLILEKDGTTLFNATFCIMQDMFESIK